MAGIPECTYVWIRFFFQLGLGNQATRSAVSIFTTKGGEEFTERRVVEWILKAISLIVIVGVVNYYFSGTC